MPINKYSNCSLHQLIKKISLTELDSADLRIVGEYTTANGPYFDDWFLVVIDKNCNWAEISFDMPDIDKFINHLNRRLRTNLIEPKLVNSTDFRSMITYPASLAGKELMRLTPEKGYNPPKNWHQKFLHGLGLGSFNCDTSIQLTEEVICWLDCASR